MAFRSWTSLSCVGWRFSSIRLLTWLLSGLAAQPAAGLLVTEGSRVSPEGAEHHEQPLGMGSAPGAPRVALPPAISPGRA